MSYADVAYVLGVFFSLYVLYKILDRLVRLPRIGGCSDRYVLITGCGHGLGLEAVRRLERIGCHVFAGCRKQESVDQLKETFSDRVQPILMDVSNRESVKNAFEYVSSQLPPNTGLWGLVNNAAIGNIIPTWLLASDIYQRFAAPNLYGAIDVTMTFLPLVQKARGRVVNVTSMFGRFTMELSLPYSVAKYGLESFSDGLRRSLRGVGCKVLIIEPGSVKTHMNDLEKVVTEFDAFWRQAQSEGRICASKETEDVYQREREKIHRQVSTLGTFASVDDVIDAYEHALFGVYPRARYVIGFDAKVLIGLQMLPEWFTDWVVSFSSL